jgi:hypothetical protein
MGEGNDYVITPAFIATAEQLVALTKEPRARHPIVCGNLANVPSFRLAPGQTLTGNGDNASISFVKGVDGLQLSSNNEVWNLRLEASAGRRPAGNIQQYQRRTSGNDSPH